MIRAVIFDMDGVVIDSEHLQSRSFEIIIEEYGKAPILNREGIVHIVGIKGNQNWEFLKKKHSIDENTDILWDKKRKVYQLLLPQVELMPGINDLIMSLKNKGMKIGLATSSTRKQVRTVLNKFNFEKLFDVVVALEDCKKPKPYPDIYLKSAKKLGLKSVECLAIEDSETGIEAAKRAGMKVIVVPTKYTKNHNFAKADLVANNLSQLKHF